MDKTLVYELYPRTWRGGLKEMEQHLERVAKLDADYVWLAPIYPSPGHDHGYDVSDYQDIDQRFGTMSDFDHFVQTAHNLGIGVLMDLVMNHTSTEHPWFAAKPQYYCWSETERPDWRNVFNGGSAWEYDEHRQEYYLHLFHKEQADLNWFPDGLGGQPNRELVEHFRSIVDFWVDEHCVDGFRLDALQALNKNPNAIRLEMDDLIYGPAVSEVIDAVFADKDAFLIMEAFGRDSHELAEYYAATGIDFVINAHLKEEAIQGKDHIYYCVGKAAASKHFMLDLESHDSPRFPSKGFTAEQEMLLLFDTGANGVCLYQGQELGLYNPSPQQLTIEMLCELDAQTDMLAQLGVNPEAVRATSRANARVPVPLGYYTMQERTPNSTLNQFKAWIKKWRA